MMRNRQIKLPNAPSYRGVTLIIVIFLLIILLLALDRSGMADPVRGQVQSWIAPVLAWMRTGTFSLGQVNSPITDVATLRAEITALQSENSQLKERLIQFEVTQLENRRLREQVRIEQERPWQLIGTAVSAMTPDSGRQIIMLAVGVEDGIQPGMAVIAQEGSQPPALVGIIESVGPQSAIALLITDFSSSVSAQVYQGEGTIAGLVNGRWQRGSRIWLEEIDREVAFSGGETVVTAGLSARLAADLPRAAIPANVPIGTIESVRIEGRSQIAEVRPYVDPSRVQYAWIIVNAGD
jgi:rod shape-determining protein MreC